uniref:Putative secreted protein n=1 Tax=Ixodes ricinus TaxID=34613 RepID=A0A6B0U330_IXORI
MLSKKCYLGIGFGTLLASVRPFPCVHSCASQSTCQTKDFRQLAGLNGQLAPCFWVQTTRTPFQARALGHYLQP